jgi:hypothetical protein
MGTRQSNGAKSKTAPGRVVHLRQFAHGQFRARVSMHTRVHLSHGHNLRVPHPFAFSFSAKGARGDLPTQQPCHEPLVAPVYPARPDRRKGAGLKGVPLSFAASGDC